MIESSAAYKSDLASTKKLWDAVKESMYSLSAREQQMGLGDEGITTYFSGNCTAKDAEIAQEFMISKVYAVYIE